MSRVSRGESRPSDNEIPEEAVSIMLWLKGFHEQPFLYQGKRPILSLPPLCRRRYDRHGSQDKRMEQKLFT